MVLNVEAEALALAVQFGADDGLDAGFGGGLGKFDGPMKVVLIGERQGRELVALGEFDDGRNGKRGVEKGIATVEVEGDEGGRET